MKSSRVTGAAALAILLSAGAFAPVPGSAGRAEAREASRGSPQPAVKAMTPEQATLRKRWAGRRATPRYPGLLKRNGWSVAQDRRNARKARNVRRNRAAHR